MVEVVCVWEGSSGKLRKLAARGPNAFYMLTLRHTNNATGPS